MATTGRGPTAPFVPGFEVDVFISYAHVDNAAPTQDWVSRLHQLLEGRLNQLLGINNAHVWRDTRLGEAPYVFEGELQRRIGSSAVFLSVLSPRYMNSESCAKEIDWFRDAARNNGGVQLDSLSRRICIVKTPPRGDCDLNGLDNTVLRVPFYRQDSFQEFACDSADFTNTCLNVAGQIAVVLDKMRQRKESAVQVANPRTVFVAETIRDLQEFRKQICSELTARGHRVLPGASLPTGSRDELEQALQSTSAEWDFSVHLLGRLYGSVPEGEERSVVRLQYDWVREKCCRPDFQQLVWIPEDLLDPEPKQQEFLKGVENNQNGNCQTEIFKTGLASFKEGLLDILTRKPPVVKGFEPLTQAKSIYLVCDQRDLTTADFQQVRTYLLSQGYPVDLPVFEGDPKDLREAEMMSLSDNDATVIYYGNAQDSWVKAKRSTIRQALKELGRSSTRAVYLSVPEKEMKKVEYTTIGGRLPEKGPFPPLLVLGDCGPFDAQQLRPLLDELRGQ